MKGRKAWRRSAVLALLVFGALGLFAGTAAFAEDRIPKYEDTTGMTDDEIAQKEAEFVEQIKEYHRNKEKSGCSKGAASASAALLPLGIAVAIKRIGS